MCGKDKGHKSEHSTESSAVNGNVKYHLTASLLKGENKTKEGRICRAKHAQSPFCICSHDEPEKVLCLRTNIILLPGREYFE